MHIPNQLQKNILNLYGAKGSEWIDNLSSLLAMCESKFNIKLDACYPDLSFHYVVSAELSTGKQCVLKCGVPGDIGQRNEIAALQHFNGHGCVRLLDIDQAAGVMLLEKITPGTTLEIVNNSQEACLHTIKLMQELHKPVTSSYPYDTLQSWCAGLNTFERLFQNKETFFSKSLIDRARKISEELLASMNNQLLLHGDLHYANILLSDENNWVAIDPKGVIGEPEFEIPLPRLSDIRQKTLKQNIDLFIEVSAFDRQRILNWLFVKCVLAAWWSFEDSRRVYKPFIKCAEIIKNLK